METKIRQEFLNALATQFPSVIGWIRLDEDLNGLSIVIPYFFTSAHQSIERELTTFLRKFNESHRTHIALKQDTETTNLILQQRLLKLLNSISIGNVIEVTILPEKLNSVSVVIEMLPRSPLTEDRLNLVIDAFFASLDIKITEIKIRKIEITEIGLSESIVLNIIKILQPVTIETLVLEAQKTYTPNQIQRLDSILDHLRKQSLIQRSRSGTYALSFKGLRAVPVKLGSRSSDIKRALAFARRNR